MRLVNWKRKKERSRLCIYLCLDKVCSGHDKRSVEASLFIMHGESRFSAALSRLSEKIRESAPRCRDRVWLRDRYSDTLLGRCLPAPQPVVNKRIIPFEHYLATNTARMEEEGLDVSFRS